MASMIDETLGELRSGITKAQDALKRELAKLRTGRANPALLEGIRVDYYGQATPISQMATVAVPEARLLTIKPWEKGQTKAIEKAIVEAGLGLNPQSDGDFIRIPMPSLTEERRKELVKIARKHAEDCKVAIRKTRHEAKEMLETLDEEGEVGSDEVERAMKKVEEIIQEATTKTDEITAGKEKDILEL
jgi:ribosome recycling factor